MKKKILIVEDDRRVLHLYQLALKKSFNIILAYNGKEAVEMALSQLPDLILMDVMMPVMDGLEAVSLLKENPVTTTIPVILLTAKSKQMNILEGYMAGADSYLTKPFTGVQLLDEINQFLGELQSLNTSEYQEFFL